MEKLLELLKSCKIKVGYFSDGFIPDIPLYSTKINDKEVYFTQMSFSTREDLREDNLVDFSISEIIGGSKMITNHTLSLFYVKDFDLNDLIKELEI